MLLCFTVNMLTDIFCYDDAATFFNIFFNSTLTTPQGHKRYALLSTGITSHIELNSQCRPVVWQTKTRDDFLVRGGCEVFYFNVCIFGLYLRILNLGVCVCFLYLFNWVLIWVNFWNFQIWQVRKKYSLTWSD